MKAVGVITDSHSGITKEEAEKLNIKVLPMPFYIDDKCYYEDITCSREEFLQKLENGINVSTSQPSPAEVMEVWDKALEEYEQVLYLPISSGLSGSYGVASAMAQEEPYEGRVFVVDTGRVSTPLHRMVLDALELINEGYQPSQIKDILEKSRENMVIYVGVQTLDYLKRGGRITSAVAAIGTILNIKPVLKFDVGTLDVFKKCRGLEKAKTVMIEAIRYDMQNRFKEYYDKGEIYLLAASSATKEKTKEWIEKIKEAFPGMEVICDPLSLGVSCHIGPGGYGIGCSCRPKRP